MLWHIQFYDYDPIKFNLERPSIHQNYLGHCNSNHLLLYDFRKRAHLSRKKRNNSQYKNHWNNQHRWVALQSRITLYLIFWPLSKYLLKKPINLKSFLNTTNLNLTKSCQEYNSSPKKHFLNQKNIQKSFKN